MNKTFNKGDIVMVSLTSETYNGRYNGMLGMVVRTFNPITYKKGRVGVKIDNIHNDSSKYDCYWFKPDDLGYVFEDKKEEINMRKDLNDLGEYIGNSMELAGEAAKAYLNSIYGVSKSNNPPAIKKVHFSGPMTVVIWEDGTKTLVKCSEDDFFDYEKGLAMAIVKKMYGNDNSFHKIFKKWIPHEAIETEDNERTEILLESLRKMFSIKSPSEDWLQNI